MGRPVNKRFFGSGAGNQIKVRAKVGSNAEGDGFIVSQRGTRKFNVTVGANTGICTLVNKNTGDLAANEMIINVLNDAGERVQVTKLFNRTAIVEGNQKIRWTFDASLTDNAVQVKDVEGPTIVILTQPQNLSVESPNSAVFTVLATGVASADLSYQWQYSLDSGSNWINLGANSATLTVTSVGDAYVDGTQIRVVVDASSADAVTSSVATLTITA